tara:strand:+ start:93 stop:404 length:312 start_codon:yes stop_codon:yes gene_type:complete
MKKIILILLFFYLLSACQSTKDALTLKKKPSGDEFLVEKKSPLVMPPDYGKLPLPGEELSVEAKKNKDTEIKEILGDTDNLKNKIEKSSEQTSIEKSILEKIK